MFKSGKLLLITMAAEEQERVDIMAVTRATKKLTSS